VWISSRRSTYFIAEAKLWTHKRQERLRWWVSFDSITWQIWMCELFRSFWEYAPTQYPFSLSSVLILLGKSHLLFVRKGFFHETENKCKSWLPLQDVAVSASVVRQQIRVENTVRFLVYALSFDVTLFVSRYWRLRVNGTTRFLAIFGSVCVQVFICTYTHVYSMFFKLGQTFHQA